MKIDPSTGQVSAQIPVGSEPSGIAAGGGSIWVSDQGSGTVYRLDPSSGQQVAPPIPVGNGPTGIAFGDGAAWVVNNTDGTVSRIDAASNSVTSIPVGQGPYDVAVGGSHVWVSNEYGNSVAEIDPVKLSVIGRTSTVSAPLGLAASGGRLWVATDGSGAVAHRGGVLYALASGTSYPNGPDAPSIDPGSAYTPPLWRLLVMTSDGLVAYRREGGVAGNELVPDLVTALPAPTDNGLTYTFHLRPGIRYSNGVPLRASDFLRGLERAFKVGGGPTSYYSVLVGGQRCLQHPATCDLSRGIVADDAANTLTFHLTQPDPDVLSLLTLPASYPVPPGTPVHLRTRWIPGTGAYEISSYTPAAPTAHGLLVLKRNPYFHQWSTAAQPTGFPDRIVVKTNYSRAQQVTAVEQGRADVAWDSPPFGELASLGQNFPTQLHTNAHAETTWLWLNVRTAPFDNLQARRAVNYVIDRSAVGQATQHAFDRGQPTCQLLPPDFPGYVPYCPYTVDPTPSGRWLAPDVAKAQALVRQSGTIGDRVTLASPSHNGPRYGQLLAATLRELGYRVRLLELSDNQFYPPDFARFYARFQAGLGNWAADYIASSNFFVPLVECSAIADAENLGGVCDHRLDAEIAAALSNQVLRPGIASQQWATIDRTVANDALVVPISNQVSSDFVARRVGNYQYNPEWGMLVDQLWVR